MFHLYGFMIGVGILAGMWIAQKQATFFKVSTSVLESALYWMFVPALLGARLYHVITDWQLYQNGSFLEVLAIWNGGLGIFGAILGGILGLLLYIKVKHRQPAQSTTMQFFMLLDLFSFGVPVAQAIGRFGNYFNQELYGLKTTLPWAITIDGQTYHPLFLYESICLTILAYILFILSRKKAFVFGKGQYVSVYIFGYGLIRFWLEFLRIESATIQGTVSVFTVAQWISILLMSMSAGIFWFRRHAPKKEWDITLE